MAGRSKLVWLIPVGGVGLLVVCAGIVGILYGLAVVEMRSSEPYKFAVARAKAHPDVIAALGSPVTEGALPSGEVWSSRGNGNAQLAIPIKGPKGKNSIFLQATMVTGRWEYTWMAVTVNGHSIDLLAEPDPNPEFGR